MLYKVCDRCGKKIPFCTGFTQEKLPRITITVYEGGFRIPRDIDLCDSCEEEVFSIWSERKGEKQ